MLNVLLQNNGRCYCIESLDDESCGKCGDKENATCGYNLGLYSFRFSC